MKVLRALLCAAVLAFQLAPASAWRSGSAPAIGAGAQINMNSSDSFGGIFINAIKQLSGGCCSGGNTPANLDSNGYPSGTLAASYSFQALLSSQAIFTGSTVQWEILWPASCTLKFQINQAVNLVSSSNATTTGGSNSNLLVTTSTSAGNVIFTFPGTTSTMAFFFATAFAHSCPGAGLAMVRVSDLTAYNAGQFYTPEFIADEAGLNSSAIRVMGVTGTNGSIQSKWAYRSTLSSLSWNGNVSMYPPGAYGGTISGTDTYTIGPAPDTPGVWTDGEVIMGQITNANTSTTPTLNVNSRGAKTIVNTSGLALSAGNLAANNFYMFVYSKILDQVIFKGSGINAFPPIEAQVQLANQVKASFWGNIPLLAQDDWINQWSSYVCSNLNSGLFFYPEYSNEVWNFSGQTQTSLANVMGLALGFPNANGEPYHGWYGLRVRQAMGNLIPTVCSGQMSRVRRVLAYQEVDTSGQIQTYRMGGKDLAPSGVSTGVGNSTYCTYTGGTFSGTCSGGADYTSAPNRPKDVSDVYSYAPYVGGTNLCTGTDLNCTPGASNVPFYQNLITLWETPNLSAAIAAVDGDIRQGLTLAQTVTASGTTFTTPLAHTFTANSTSIAFTVAGGTSYSGLSPNALYRVTTTPTSTTFTTQPYVNGVPTGADINAGSAGSGTVTVGSSGIRNLLRTANIYYPYWEVTAAADSKRVDLYEGATEPQGLSAAQCTSLGIVTNPVDPTGVLCASEIAAAITAWKNDPSAAATTLVYANQFLGKDAGTPVTFGVVPHSKTPSQLNLTGPNLWSILPGDPGSTPYQTYNGWAQVRNVP